MKARARGMGANCVVGFKLTDFYVSEEAVEGVLCIICLTGNAVLYEEDI